MRRVRPVPGPDDREGHTSAVAPSVGRFVER